MIASTPPTCCRCVLRLSREEKTHSSRPNIYREEKGEHFWSKKLIPQILLQHIWSIWLVSGHYNKIWDSSFWNQPKSKVNILLWKRHGCARGIRPPRSPEWICMKYFRFGVKQCGDKYLTEPASSKSRRSSRRRNYARIRGDIPSPVQVIVNAMQCGFHTGVAESSSDITYAAAAAEITCLKIQSNSSRITVLRSHHPPFCLLIKLSSSLQIFSTKIPS